MEQAWFGETAVVRSLTVPELLADAASLAAMRYIRWETAVNVLSYVPIVKDAYLQ